MPDFHPFKGRVSKHFHDNHDTSNRLGFETNSSNKYLAPDDAYLSYYDIRLTREDVDCIKNDWLTDNAIAFWEEYLEREKLRDYKAGHGNVNLVLLRPAMSFLLKNTPDPRSLKDALPKFENVSHIFLPINDNQNVELAEGGSHWSLLVVSKIDGIAFHYDSLSSANEADAQLACRKLSALLYDGDGQVQDIKLGRNETPTATPPRNSLSANHVNHNTNNSFGKSLRFVDLEDSPQQENGSDCGVFVCMQMQYILLEKLLRTDCRQETNMSLGGVSFNAVNGRKMLLKAIETFRKQGEKNRSISPSPRHHGKSPPRVGEET